MLLNQHFKGIQCVMNCSTVSFVQKNEVKETFKSVRSILMQIFLFGFVCAQIYKCASKCVSIGTGFSVIERVAHYRILKIFLPFYTLATLRQHFNIFTVICLILYSVFGLVWFCFVFSPAFSLAAFFCI